MSRTMLPTELKAHCDDAVSQLQSLLNDFADSDSGKTVKRSMLLAYWIKTYIQYIRKEDSFSPESVYRLKRGSVVRVEFGYRVGRELGGRHYAVVLDVKNPIHRNTVTVVPLGSLKEELDGDFNVVLEDGIYSPMYHKIAALIADANRMADEAEAMKDRIEASAPEDAASLRAVFRQKLAAAKAQLKTAQAWIEDISQMKPGSVVKVDQITTISKMRISAPLQKTHPLYGVRLSPRDMDSIDQRLQELYFPRPPQA